MFTSQKGLFPFVSKITGLIIFVYPTLMVIAYSVRELFIDFTAENIFLRFLAATLVLFFPLWISLFLLNMFPKIKLTEQGIKYLSFSLTIRLIKWDEVESLVYFRNGYAALILQKRGFILLNGLYYNKLYGMIVRAFDPVIFVAPNILDQSELLANLSERKIRIVREKLV